MATKKGSAKATRTGKVSQEQGILKKLGGDQSLLTAYQKLSKLFAESATGNIQSRWDMGHILAEVVEEHKEAVDGGDGAVRNLAAVLEWNYQEALHVLRFAQTFDGKSLARVLAMRSPRGKSLTWTYVRISLRIEDVETRMKLLQHALDANQTTDDFELKVRAATGKKKKNGSGPRLAQPKSIKAGVHMVGKQTADWLKRQRDIFKPYVLDRLSNTPADDVDEDLLQQVSDVRQQLDQLAEEAAEDAKAFKEAEKRLQSMHRFTQDKLKAGEASEASESPASARAAAAAKKAAKPVSARAAAAAKKAKAT